MKLTPNGETFLARIDRNIEATRAKNGLGPRRALPPAPATRAILAHALLQDTAKRHRAHKMVEQISGWRATKLRCEVQAGQPPPSGDGFLIWRVRVDACVAEEMNRH